MKLELHATPEEVMRAVDALREYGEAQGVPGKVLFGLTLALEECGSNIVNHGLRGDAARVFQVGFEEDGGVFTIELRDDGPEFDPTQRPQGELEAEDDAEPGGWGIFLVRRYTDEITYARDGGENVLCLIKRLDFPPSLSSL